MKRATKTKIGYLVSITLIAVLILTLFMSSYLKYKVAKVTPMPGQETVVDDAGFPYVDWNYWTSINPDIIGWITIEGTSINYPIVQAQTSEPTYYLTHDIYREWNPYGAIYLDAGCVEDGLDSQNAIIFGHNMGGYENSMFADIAEYSSRSYAENHQEIQLQTPEWKKSLTVEAVDILQGWEARKRTYFEDEGDYLDYHAFCFNESLVKLADNPSESSSIYTLVTCSYNYWSQERTLVYAI